MMKRIFIYGITAVIIFLSYQYPRVMLNPGELAAGHQDIKDKCISCHKPFWGIENERCITCHKPNEIGLKKVNSNEINANKKKILFHDKLVNHNCASCHTDHKGVKQDVSMNSFSHELLSGTIINKCIDCHLQPSDKLHLQLSSECKNCHNTSGWKNSVTFSHDMIQGTEKENCSACHKKPDDEFHRLSEDNCGKCHSTAKWVPSSFDHTSYFQLDKNHDAKCIVCHTTNIYKVYTCYGCHEHTQGNIMEKHNEEGISDFNDCVSCHKSGNEHDTRINGKSENGSEQKGNQNSEGSDKIKKSDKKKNNDREEDERDDD